MNILCLSKLTYDVFCPIDGELLPDSKYYIKERQECGGGEAANAAFLLGKWGIKSLVAGVVGADDFAAKIKKEFSTVLIDTSCIETSYEKPTILTFIPINKKDGTKTTIRAYKSDYAYLRKHDFGMAPEFIITDGHEYSATHEILEKNSKAVSILCAEKPTPEILELIKFSKYVLASKEFAETITNIKFDFANPTSLVNIYQTLKNRFPNCEMVITLGNKGALYSLNGEIKIMPGLNTKVVDTSGAGDAFRGAFAYGLINGFTLDKTIAYANLAAGLTIGKIGTRIAFPTLNEVINYYNQKFPPTSASSTTNNQTTVPQQGNVTSPQQPNTTNSNAAVANPNSTVTPPTTNSTASAAPNLDQQANQNSAPSMAIPDKMPEIPDGK